MLLFWVLLTDLQVFED